MDFCFEKTNSAYMLFYERGSSNPSNDTSLHQSVAVQVFYLNLFLALRYLYEMMFQSSTMADVIVEAKPIEAPSITLSPELQMWIWEDNMNFLHQKNIFQHAYFT
jgi:hypothetical protein